MLENSQRLRKIVKIIVQAVGAAGSFFFALQNVGGIVQNTTIEIIILAIILLVAGLYIFFDFRDSYNNQSVFVESKKHKFNVPSDEHTNFFVEWYKKDGELTVYCESLDGWAKPKDGVSNSIYEELLQKSKNKELNLYIIKVDDHVTKLKGAGAKVHQLTEKRLDFTFSLIHSDTTYAIILRDKSDKQNTNEINVIEELNHSIVSKLIGNMIDSIET